MRYGSLMRPMPYQDTNTALDWVATPFATKGGHNDVDPRDGACQDLDLDGIPDCAERYCGTYAGLPYYAWGARLGVQDVFLEVDWMQTDEDRLRPPLSTLRKLQDVFSQATHPMKLHIDAGALWAASQNMPELFLYSPEHQDDDHRVPYRPSVSLTQENSTYNANVFYYNERYMDIRRQGTFYYVLLADQVRDTAARDIRIDYVAFYKSFIVTVGQHVQDIVFEDDYEMQDYYSNMLSSTLLHELGHTLGLWHGGDEVQNYKPNYLSSMNYLYVSGLPDQSFTLINAM